MEARTLWHIDPTETVIRPARLSRPAEGECLVKSRFSMVSMGTERLVARGGVPPALRDSMRVPYMDGAFSFPLTYGYSLVGEVVEGPREWLGERVHLLHPHQDYCLVRTRDLTVIPPALPMHRAVLASNLETAVNALWDARPLMGQDILVIGFGLVGALIAHLQRDFPGVRLRVQETLPARAQLARSLGYQVVDTQDLGAIREEFDLVYHTAANALSLQQGIESLRMDGTLIELSWYGQQSVTLELGGSFHYGRKRIISSQVSHLAPAARTGWTHARRKELVFRLLEDPTMDQYLGQLIAFEDAPAFFKRLRGGVPGELNACFSYGE